MPANPPLHPVPPPTKALDIIIDAFAELNIHDPSEAVPTADAAFGVRKLNQILDVWAARSTMAYNVGFQSYTLTPNHQPHTIGPGPNADFVVPQRPVLIKNANILLTNSSPSIRQPLDIWDDDDWNNERVPGLASTIPIALYPSPDIPNMSLFLWPVPTVAYGLELETWGLFTQFVDVNSPVILPPGYKTALTLLLAVNLAGPFTREISPGLATLAKQALSTIQGVNSTAPKMVTVDSGMPRSGRSQRPDFNFLTGGRS